MRELELTTVPWCNRSTRIAAILGWEDQLQVSNVICETKSKRGIDIKVSLRLSEYI